MSFPLKVGDKITLPPELNKWLKGKEVVMTLGYGLDMSFRVVSDRFAAALVPSLTPKAWRDDSEINLNELTHAEKTAWVVPVAEEVKKTRTLEKIAREQRELSDGLLSATFAALDRFAHNSWVAARRKVKEAKDAARVTTLAIKQNAKKLAQEVFVAIRGRMQKYCAATVSAWKWAATKLKARMVHDLGVAKVPVLMPGLAGSRGLVRNAQAEARRIWMDLRKTYLSLDTGI